MRVSEKNILCPRSRVERRDTPGIKSSPPEEADLGVFSVVPALEKETVEELSVLTLPAIIEHMGKARLPPQAVFSCEERMKEPNGRIHRRNASERNPERIFMFWIVPYGVDATKPS